MTDVNDTVKTLRLRQELIAALTQSTGDEKTAEFCVNNLTIHKPELLARAARVFAADYLDGARG